MKSIILLLTILSLKLSGQFNCSFTINPTYSFFANGVVNYTNSTTFNQSVYVCGDETTVYDTLLTNQGLCREVYLEKNTKYIIKGSCFSVQQIFARANSTVVILPGTGLTGYLHEPGAIITNPTPTFVMSNTCAVLNFGTTECSKTGIDSYGMENSIRVFPNPVSDQLTIASTSIYSYSITDSFGQTIREEEFRILNDSFSINTSSLAPGLYLLHLKTQFGVVTKKVIKAK